MNPLLIGAVAAPIVGGIIGNEMSRGDRDAARSASARALQAVIDLGFPPETAKQVVLDQYKQAGLLTPELETQISVDTSKVAGIQEDPALKERQMSALNLIAQRATGGLNAEDRAKFNELRNQQAKEQQAKQQQIIQQYQMRGMGGSGAELAAALAESQSGANQASEQGDRLAAQSSAAAREAALQALQGSGSIRQQDFDVNRTRATAEDEMNRFNVQNQIAQQARNVGAKNQAQQYNLSAAQRAQDANVQQLNQERLRMRQAEGTDWDRQANRAAMVSNALSGQANQLNNTAAQTSGMYSGIGSGIGAGLGAYQNQQNSDRMFNLISKKEDPGSQLDFTKISDRSKKFAGSGFDPGES